jgi:uncharacterized protein (DUF1778 family)
MVLSMARPKVEESRKHSSSMRVRLLPEHDALIREAAEHATRRKGSGDLSDWLRETLVAAARRELKRGEGED